jgi:hypothetical protein
MTATLRVPRSRGALSGLLLVLLGLWGALMPLIGPSFHFGFAPDKTWHLTYGRVWLQIVPGAAVFLGGLIALASGNRAFAAFGAWLAALGGAWFAIGAPLSGLWADHNATRLGTALGDTTRQVAEQLSLLYGLGVVSVFLAAVALGRLAVVGVKDAALAEQDADPPIPGRDPVPPAGRTGAADTTVEQRRPFLPRRKNRDVSGARGTWEEVPPTPTEPMSPQATTPSDVKVAGRQDAGDTRRTERPGAGT